MNILLSANEEFVEFAKDLLISIKRNNYEEELNIYFLYLKISSEKLQSLKKFVEENINSKIHFYKLDIAMFSGLPVTNKKGNVYFGPEAYLRLFAQYVLPEKIDRILYLDIDIICNGSIKILYNMDFENNYYIACEDIGATCSDKERIGIKSDAKYINSGVLLINLKLLRENQKISELKDYIYQNKDILTYPDQDILNMLYNGKFLIANNRYNYTQFKKQDKIKSAILYHYVGKVKPWNTKKIYKIKLGFLLIYLKNEIYKKKYFKVIYISIYYMIFRIFFLVKKIIFKILGKAC